jgi:hypothetical protein
MRLAGSGGKAAQVIPNGGSLQNAFAAAAALDPKPDNIMVITDGLPTRAMPPLRKTVSADAASCSRTPVLPSGVPVNTILFLMEGSALEQCLLAARAEHQRMIAPAKDGHDKAFVSRGGGRSSVCPSWTISCGFGAIILLIDDEDYRPVEDARQQLTAGSARP